MPLLEQHRTDVDEPNFWLTPRTLPEQPHVQGRCCVPGGAKSEGHQVSTPNTPRLQPPAAHLSVPGACQAALPEAAVAHAAPQGHYDEGARCEQAQAREGGHGSVTRRRRHPHHPAADAADALPAAPPRRRAQNSERALYPLRLGDERCGRVHELTSKGSFQSYLKHLGRFHHVRLPSCVLRLR